MKKDIRSLGDIRQDADPDVEIHALRRKEKELKAEIKKMQADYGDLRGYFRDINEAAKDLIITPTPKIYKPPREKKSVSSPCPAVLHWTDWHYGAVQDSDELEGMGSFSPEQLEARILNLNEDFLNWVEVLRNGYLIDELVILDTGDMISGDIHRELSVTNAFPTPVQAFRCGVFKASAIAELAPLFRSVRVEFVVDDNHGRLTAKPQAKQAGMNSHNYVVGHVAKLLCKNLANVEFNIHISHNKAVTVANRQYLITHGHDVMGWAGFPYYGIERKVAREALGRMWEPDFNKFHLCIMGHWHAPLTHPYYWIGGSASGTDAYDRKQGRRSPPKQTAWLVHPRKKEFNYIPFDLRDE